MKQIVLQIAIENTETLNASNTVRTERDNDDKQKNKTIEYIDLSKENNLEILENIIVPKLKELIKQKKDLKKNSTI